MANPGQTPPTAHKRRAVWGWAFYDWANSAFATTVMAAFFPIFFKQYWGAGMDVNLSTARLGFGNAAAGLLVALFAPVLGAVADSAGRRKRFLIAFTYLGVLMTAALALIPSGRWALALFVYAMGIVGFSGAVVFYDAMLPQIAPEADWDRVSSLGYALGYLGGGLLFLVNVAMTLKPHFFGLADAGQAVRLSFATVAVWWGGFGLMTFLLLPPDPAGERLPLRRRIAGGWRRFTATLRQVRRFRTLFLFLMAYWCYIDGVDTIIRMAVDFGMSLGFAFQDLIAALLITQFVGFPAAILFGRLGGRWGVRRAIFLALSVYMACTLGGAAMTTTRDFYILAAVIGLVQGGIQALSRSYYARLIPRSRSAEFFGFYNMLGKFAVIIGPALMGMTGLLVRHLLLPPSPSPVQLLRVELIATRSSIVSVLLLFAAGAVLFYFVDEKKGRAELRRAGL